MTKNTFQACYFFAFITIYACTPKTSSLLESSNTENTKSKEETTVYFIYRDGDFVEEKLDKEPEPIGGETNFYRVMYQNMNYPAEARKKGVEGTVVVRVILNTFGQLEEAVVVKGIGAGCDEEALKAVKKGYQVGFEPAMKNGQAVKVKYGVSVNFKLG